MELFLSSLVHLDPSELPKQSENPLSLRHTHSLGVCHHTMVTTGLQRVLSPQV